LSFLYFAYGSNLWLPQMRGRCPSATPRGPATLAGWAVDYDKPSRDGSAKANIRSDAGQKVLGVVYEVEDGERQALDQAEHLYSPIYVNLEEGIRALTYAYEGPPHEGPPYDWYVSTTLAGAAAHGIPADGLDVPSRPDPLAPGMRAASPADLGLMQDIVSHGLRTSGDCYYVHPGDIAWWLYHDDPRSPDRLSCWVQGEDGFVVIDTREPSEISVFARPGIDRVPLIRWAQRRLGGRGEVGWVSDHDYELVTHLETTGYESGYVYRAYQWDLSREIPEPRLPAGWVARSVSGEEEADSRRAAAHSAFDSTMPPAMHLDRYLAFMRSPVYVPERDLVVVAPDGTVVSFVVWWADDSGTAQIEPFGTHPDYHRRGLGTALMQHALGQMKGAGMSVARVCTDEDRPATAFYEACGFEDAGRLRWWAPV
jgi:mycothiol synthase